MAGKQNAVAPTTAQQTGIVLSEFDQEIAEAGAQHEQHFEERDKTIPRLKVLQGLSPQVTRGEPQYNPEAKVGQFIDTSTGRLWEGEETGLLLIPIFYTRSVTEWKPRREGGGLVKDWGTDASVIERTTRNELGRSIITSGEGQGHEVVDSARYYVMVVDEDSHDILDSVNAVFDLTSTQLKKARGWNNFIDGVRHTTADGRKVKPPMYYMSYRVTTVPEKNDRGNWMGVKITPQTKTLELPNGPAFFAAAKAFRELISEGRVVVSTDDQTESTSATSEGGASNQETDDLPF